MNEQHGTLGFICNILFTLASALFAYIDTSVITCCVAVITGVGGVISAVFVIRANRAKKSTCDAQKKLAEIETSMAERALARSIKEEIEESLKKHKR